MFNKSFLKFIFGFIFIIAISFGIIIITGNLVNNNSATVESR